MNQVIGDWIGLVHLITSILAMFFGAFVLLSKKGTKLHKSMGYAYTVSMLFVLVTALLIYRLFGKFGPFHIITVIGFVYIVGGILPAFFRFKSWLKYHVYFMYWSVVGLYAAFVAEVAVRVPNSPFWWMVGIGTLVVTIIGGLLYAKHKRHWIGIIKK